MSPIKLFWWKPSHPNKINLGDEISGRIAADVSGREVVHSDLANCEMLSIGSILSFPLSRKVFPGREEPMHVWGSGLASPGILGERVKYIYASVRGPMTRCLVDGTGNLPLGDPGILSSEVWKASTEKRHAWGIIPHHSRLKDPIYEKLRDATPNAVIIDFTDPDVEATMRTLSSCESILSSSLHGLIIADSYRIPSYWHKTDKALHAGNSWKFYDYFASVGRTTLDGVAIPEDGNLSRIIPDAWEFAHFHRVGRVQAAVRASFPSALRA